MLKNEDYKEKEKQLEGNLMNWYPLEKDIKYIIIKDFCKEKEMQLSDVARDLRPNQKILLIVDNKVAIKNICRVNVPTDNLYNRRELEELLNSLGLVYRKFYYILPDTKMANVVFTDKYLPDKDSINRDVIFYKDKEVVKNEEVEEFKKILEVNSEFFKIFANTFFIECSKNEFNDNRIEFVSFSNMRKEVYQIKTTIIGDYVYKQAANDKAIHHIANIKNNIDIIRSLKLNILDSYKDDIIVSEYQKNQKTVDLILLDFIRDNKREMAKKIINNIYEELKDKCIKVNCQKNVFDKYAIKYEADDVKDMTFVKYGFWDAIFQNVFLINEKYYFYDQEWMEENLPVEFIIFRALVYCTDLQKIIDIKEFLDIYKISDKQIGMFQELDIKLQEKIRNENDWKMHNQYITHESIINEYEAKISLIKQQQQTMYDESVVLLNQKDSRIKLLEQTIENNMNEIREKENIINGMKQSFSWKITKPLRRLRRKKPKKR